MKLTADTNVLVRAIVADDAKQAKLAQDALQSADVIALSGYILDRSGRPAIAFSFMASGVRGKTSGAREAMDRAAGGLASKVWEN